VTAEFEWEGSIVLLGVLQHRLHPGRVMRGLERLNSEQGEGSVEPNPPTLRDRVISFVLQSAVPPHGKNTAFVIQFNVRAVRIIGDVDRVNRVIHRKGDIDPRSFARIR